LGAIGVEELAEGLMAFAVHWIAHQRIQRGFKEEAVVSFTAFLCFDGRTDIAVIYAAHAPNFPTRYIVVQIILNPRLFKHLG